ncbi:response regulator [Patescibacteria group bacterium]|nr:response regulator [Patescibacteria group bacterium]MBU1672993.1 response regulator [Patescibacteria group bacterium]MBU1962972.1 response regulator [Patescibacteria group bacterium]
MPKKSTSKSTIKPSKEPVKKTATGAKNKGNKLMVVDDDRFITKVYSIKLAHEGYDVILAYNGEEALEKAKKDKPGLILLDLIMPRMDGFETLERLKKNPKLKNVPVLILSNLGQDTDIDRAMELGAEDYLVKSNISLKYILEKIDQYM